MRLSRRTGIVAVLGATQTLAWASSYYLPAMLAAPMARDLGVATSTVFAAFSFALLVSALLGPGAGRAIDRWGGRPVLMATNLVFALGLAWLGSARGPAGLFSAWAVLGIGMGSGLYEAAFASLVRLYGRESRGAISGITLIAGFASTVGWPLSSFLELQVGWRGACYAWAGLHLFLALPLNAMLPSAARLAALAHPAGAALLLALGAPLASAFVILHGAGNGILTIAKGTLPLALFGPQGYGARQGLLMVPARIAQALAPWLFGLGLDRWGAGALWISAGLGAVAFAALLALRPGKAGAAAAAS